MFQGQTRTSRPAHPPQPPPSRKAGWVPEGVGRGASGGPVPRLDPCPESPPRGVARGGGVRKTGSSLSPPSFRPRSHSPRCHPQGLKPSQHLPPSPSPTPQGGGLPPPAHSERKPGCANRKRLPRPEAPRGAPFEMRVVLYGPGPNAQVTPPTSHLLPSWPRSGSLTFPSFSFHTCKMQVVMLK